MAVLHAPVLVSETLGAARAVAWRPLRRLHGRSRGPQPGAPRSRSIARARPRPRRGRARAGGGRTRPVWRSRRARARRLPRSRAGARRPRDRAHRRRPRRPGRVLDAARCRRARVQLSARRAARHAHGPLAPADGCRSAGGRRRRGAGERDLPVRRRALLAPDRAGDRAGPGSLAGRDDWPARAHRPARDSGARPPAHRSRDANVPGVAHPGQSRARGTRCVSSAPRSGGSSPAAGWR